MSTTTFEEHRAPNPREDEKWPKASDWIKGAYSTKSDGESTLGIVGVPLNCSLTPGRSDLTPPLFRKVLERFTIFDLTHNNDLRTVGVEDIGDLDVAHLQPEQAVQPISDAMRDFRERNMPVVLLGGDNSVTRPGVMGLTCPIKNCGLLTLDAHFDLRDLDSGLHNGNPIRALLQDGLLGHHIVQIGIQSFSNSPEYAQLARDVGINFVTSEEVYHDGVDFVMRTAFEHLRDLDAIYVDLDMDVLDRAYAPATPGSRPGGLQPWQLRQIAYHCGSHYNIAAMDIVEIDPEKDVSDVTIMGAAACMLSFASGLLERRAHK